MRMLAVGTLLTIALLLGSCGVPPDRTPPPQFNEGDLLLFRSGGGAGEEDRLEIRGDGQVIYLPLGQTRGRSARLSPEQRDELWQKLLAAGLLQLTDTPNREVETHGLLLELRLAGHESRASIGALQMQKRKHHTWQQVVEVFVALLEEHRLLQKEPL